MSNKLLFIILGVIILPFVLVWIFNHVNPWIPFLIIVIIIFIINQSFKSKKKNEVK